MNTPILDFLQSYREKNMLRFHMPGHKGKNLLGIESLDITEVSGADSLYEANGIIAQSEANTTALFGAQATFYSAEGSSQCIRAMLHLVMQGREKGTKPLVLAARNVHKAFVYAAALLDIEVQWLWPEQSRSVCSCPITAEHLDTVLESMDEKPAAVYITSPDYLGHMADIAALSAVCHRHGVLLMVDNAHGAYLHFLDKPQHPLDLGADICCDSAHKTLPVLTGGAYLHISHNLPKEYAERAKNALALFGSTSPSYLIMASLDACNAYLEDGIADKLSAFIKMLDELKRCLVAYGWQVEGSDPLRLTLRAKGIALAEKLRKQGVEVEYADNDYIVFMFTPQNTADELRILEAALLTIEPEASEEPFLILPQSEQCVSIRNAVISPAEIVDAIDAVGRICASPLVSCPPAIPIVVSGEKICPAALDVFKHYGIDKIEVIK